MEEWLRLGGMFVLAVPVAAWAAKFAAEKAVERKFREWEVRFSKLHERRVEVMEGMQDRLVELQRALEAASGIQSLEDPHGLEHLQKAADAGNEAHRYLASRRYYLPEETAHRLAEVLGEMRKAHTGLASGAEGLAEGQSSPVYMQFRLEGHEAVRKKLPLLLAAVEDDFRKLIRG